MKVLLDHGVSPRLRRPLQDALDGIPVESAMFRNWSTLTDGELLTCARRDGFTVLLTTDKRLAREQAPLPIAVIALDDNRWSTLLSAVDRIAAAIRKIRVGQHRDLAVRE